MSDLIRLGLTSPTVRGARPSRLERAIRLPMQIEEVRAAQAATSIENICDNAMEAGASIVYSAQALAAAVPEASPVLAQIASEGSHALATLVRKSGKRLSQ